MLSADISGMYHSLLKKGFPPVMDTAVILGSGLGGFENELGKPSTIKYDDIPGFPHTSVIGHKGILSTGLIGERHVLVFSGRFHHYEGYPYEMIVMPVQLAKTFGVKLLIVTNAAGGINPGFKSGDLMLIVDLLTFGIRFYCGSVESQRCNNEQLIDMADRVALKLKIPVRKGTYIYSKGPSYETGAEIRTFRKLGADAVGMSTAPELLEASRLGLSALGISLITNKATGISNKKLTHQEIKKTAEQRKPDFTLLLKSLIDQI